MRLLRKLLAVGLLVTSSAFAAPQTVVMDVQNLSCPFCTFAVEKALKKVPGVEKADVDSGKKTATVKFDSAKTNTAALIKATTDAGFPSTVKK